MDALGPLFSPVVFFGFTGSVKAVFVFVLRFCADVSGFRKIKRKGQNREQNRIKKIQNQSKTAEVERTNKPKTFTLGLSILL